MQNSSSMPIVLQMIDTLDYGGVARKTLHYFDVNGDELNVIDGIGSSSGLVTNFDWDVYPTGKGYLWCAYLDEIEPSAYGSCVVGLAELKLDISLYPNPVQNQLYIELENTSTFDCKVYDLSGRLVYDKNNLSSGSSISTLDWKRGVYQIVIRTEQGLSVQKVIKE